MCIISYRIYEYITYALIYSLCSIWYTFYTAHIVRLSQTNLCFLSLKFISYRNMSDYKDTICRYQYRDTVKYPNSNLIIASYAVNAVFTLVCSSALIFGLRTTIRNKKYTRNEKLVFALSVVDITNTLVVPSSQVVLLRQVDNLGCLEISIVSFFRVWFLGLTSSIFVMISCERFLTVLCNNMLCGVIIKDSYLIAYFIFIVFFSLGGAAFYGIIYATSNLYLQYLLYIGTASITLVFLVLIVVANVSMLIGTIKKLRKSAVRIERNAKVESHITKTVIMISLAHVLFYTPCLAAQYYLSFIFSKNDISLVPPFHSTFMWTVVVREMSSGLNALIYILRNRKISKVYALKINSLLGNSAGVRNSLVQETTTEDRSTFVY